MSIVRKYKLWKLGIPQTPETKEILEFIEHSLSDLTIKLYFKVYNNLQNVNLYVSSTNFPIFEHFNNTNSIYIREDVFWKILIEKHHLQQDDIIPIIKNILEERYGITSANFRCRDNKTIWNSKTNKYYTNEEFYAEVYPT